MRIYSCPECPGFVHVTNNDKAGGHIPNFQLPVKPKGTRLKLAPERTLAEVEEIAAKMRGKQ